MPAGAARHRESRGGVGLTVVARVVVTMGMTTTPAEGMAFLGGFFQRLARRQQRVPGRAVQRHGGDDNALGRFGGGIHCERT